MTDERTRVLVVGAGLAGLSTALFAAARGVDVLLVEKHATPSPQPSPTGQDTLGQGTLELLLRAHAAELGARIRFSTELVSFEQDADGVTTRLLDRWRERLHTARADYLVAADGRRSPIRRELGSTECFRSGRVLFAGDAARALPPADGLGGDIAIGDGYDLGWKLAAVCAGEAGPGLLDSYQAERNPAAEAALTRAPCVPLIRAGIELSTTDLFGAGWVLLTGVGGGIWHAAAANAATVLGIRLDAYGLGPELTDPTGTLTERYGIGEAGASLIRPDGVIAWRVGYEVTDPAATVLGVLRRLLDRPIITSDRSDAAIDCRVA